jgi:DNA-binding protein WhiA
VSFTSEVKDELSRVEPTCSRCEKSELSALIRIEGTLSISGDGPRLELATETASVARTAIRLLHSVYDLKTDLTVRRSILHKTHNYLITAPAQSGLTDALHDMGILGSDGFEGGIKEELVERGCCAGAYLRGAFMGGGYIADPRGDFHFELAGASEELIRACLRVMGEHDIKARYIRRHNMYTIYIKGVDQIIAFLAFVGAHHSALAIENVRVIKSVRNDTNRRVNAEIANQVKTSNAAMEQIEQIRRLVDQQGIDSIPSSLQEVAALRLRNPDASIKELGELADPPLSKNAVYHRLRRIAALAQTP